MITSNKTARINFVMSVCIYQLKDHRMDFHKIWYWGVLNPQQGAEGQTDTLMGFILHTCDEHYCKLDIVLTPHQSFPANTNP